MSKRVAVFILICAIFLFVQKDRFSILDLRDVGLQFDDVYRVNNIIPLVNPDAEAFNDAIFSLDMFEMRIPLMYKSYVSSAGLVRYLWLYFFEDYLLGYRATQLLWSFIALVGFYFVMSKFSMLLAFSSSLLVICSPVSVVFPYHLALLSVGAWGLSNYFGVFSAHSNSRKLRYLVVGMLALGLATNMQIYLAWQLVAVLCVLALLFPKESLSFIYNRPVAVVVALAAFGCGIVNHLLYNLANGLPAIMTIYTKLMSPEDVKIDYKVSRPLALEIPAKLEMLWAWWGQSTCLLFLTGGAFVMTIVMAYKWRRDGGGLYVRATMAPWLLLLFSLCFILISPNTTRRGHYAFISPYFEIAVSLPLFLAAKLFKKEKARIAMLIVALTLICGVAGVGLYHRNTKVLRPNSGYFSPAIFALHDHIKENAISSNKIVFLHWGMHAQLYFLARGEFKINQSVWRLIGRGEDEHAKEFGNILVNKRDMKTLYFPLYFRGDSRTMSNRDGDGGLWKAASRTSDYFVNFLEKNNINYKIDKIFNERNGKPIIALYKVDRGRSEIASKVIKEDSLNLVK